MSNANSHKAATRKLWPTEAGKFRDHLLRLDKDSRRLRFAHSVSDAFIEDYASRMAEYGSVVYGHIADGRVRAAAELRRLGDAWGEEAEAAFSVEKAFQDQGVGSELMGRIVRAARNRGIRRLYMSCLAENSKMQTIARKYEAELQVRVRRGDRRDPARDAQLFLDSGGGRRGPRRLHDCGARAAEPAGAGSLIDRSGSDPWSSSVPGRGGDKGLTPCPCTLLASATSGSGREAGENEGEGRV